MRLRKAVSKTKAAEVLCTAGAGKSKSKQTMRPIEPPRAKTAPRSENNSRSNVRRRDRSRSREFPRRLPFPTRDHVPDDSSAGNSPRSLNNDDSYISGKEEQQYREALAISTSPPSPPSSSSSCGVCPRYVVGRCPNCAVEVDVEEYRDLSIRYPGMTRDSYDEMTRLIDADMTDLSDPYGDFASYVASAAPAAKVVPASPSEIHVQAPDEDTRHDYPTESRKFQGAIGHGQIEFIFGEAQSHFVPESPPVLTR